VTGRLETAAYMLGFTPEEARNYQFLAKEQFPDRDAKDWEDLAILAMKKRREIIAMNRAREGVGDVGLEGE
jgi:hypothetical protein